MHFLRILLVTIRSGQFWRLFPHWFYRWLRARQIDATAPILTTDPDDEDALHICIMTGRKQQYDALYAVKSFVCHFGAPASVSIYCDDSVDRSTTDRLCRHLPRARLWLRKERDQIVAPWLENRGLTRCAEFQKLNLFAPKLIDVFVLTQARRILLMDSDCLSFRALVTLRQLVASPTLRAAFGRDPLRDPYALPAEVLEKHFGVPVARHLNAGFCLVNREVIDFPLVEHWLSQQAVALDHFHSEQAIWAGLIGAGPYIELPSAEYNMGRDSHDERTCALVHYCGHYLSATRLAMQRIGQRLVLDKLRPA